MDVDHATGEEREKRGGDEATEGHHDPYLCAGLLNPPDDLGRLEVLGLKDLQAVAKGHIDYRRRGQHSLSTNGLAGSRNDQQNLVRAGNQPLEAGNRKHGCPEKDDFHREMVTRLTPIARVCIECRASER